MLQIANITKRFDRFEAVSDLSLHIPDGELFCFLGPNGAGKTTTIKMVTGLLRPSEGQIQIGGHDIQRDPVAAKALVGYIPDTPYLYEKLSGREFLHFIGDLYGVTRPKQERAMEKYFEVFGLSPDADKLIENYSHGMRQKLCFSVAFMHDPKLLVVDEPMVGLDPRSMRTLKNLLREYCAEGGTVFLSTHLLPIAEELSDRLGIITKSRLRYLGTTEDLRRQLAREGTLEDLFLHLTEEGAEAEDDVPIEPPADSAAVETA